MKLMYFLLLILLPGFVFTQNLDSLFGTKEFINEFAELEIKQHLNKKDRVVVRWNTDILIFIENDSLPELKIELLNFVKEVEPLLNGIKIKIVSDKGESNYIIDFSKVYFYENKYSNWWDSEHNIYKGFIALNPRITFNKKERITILKEMFIFSLGNSAHSNSVSAESLFNSSYSSKKHFTKKDAQYIQFLYSDKLTPGMSTKEVKKMIIK